VVAIAMDPARGILHAGINGGGVAELAFPQGRAPVTELPRAAPGTRRISAR
jgi:hypothetical protein